MSLPKIESKISAARYLEITDIIRNYLQSGISEWKDFKELSYEAWCYSEKVNSGEEDDPQNRDSAIPDKNVPTVHYWLYSPGDNASMWEEFYNAGIMGIGWDQIGDLRQYKSQNEMLKKMKECINPEESFKAGSLATWQFYKVMKKGDIVFAKRGRKQIIGKGVVESDYEFDPDRNTYKNVRHGSVPSELFL